MNLQRLVSAATIGIAALSATSMAQAVTVWNFSYSGTAVTASGTFTTAGNAAVAEDVLSITGTRNGVAITGLVPLDTDPDFAYDNQFVNAAIPFTDGGIVFSTAGGTNYNVYYFNGTVTDLVIDPALGPLETSVTFTASVSAVPEPSTALAMMAGLGLLGLYARKSRAQG